VDSVLHPGELGVAACRHKILLILSKRIDGTAYIGRPTVEDMDVNHRRLHVFMPHEFLHCPNIVTAFQQVGCKRMPKRMACGPLRQSGFHDCVFDGFPYV
jgi:hypothetical protein